MSTKYYTNTATPKSYSSVALNLEDYYHQVNKKRKSFQETLNRNCTDEPNPKRTKVNENFVVKDVVYNRKIYPKTASPIQIVRDYCMKEKMKPPVFNTMENDDRLYKSEMSLNGKTYTTVLHDKRKKSAEQAAAIAFLLHHNMHDGRLTS